MKQLIHPRGFQEALTFELLLESGLGVLLSQRLRDFHAWFQTTTNMYALLNAPCTKIIY